MSRTTRGPKAKQTTAFLNPFYIYGAMGSLTLVLYKLGWSTIYDPLNPVLLVFLSGTIAMSAALGVTLQPRLSLDPPAKYSRRSECGSDLVVAVRA